MAVIPPRDLNAAASVSDTDVLIVDKGSSVEKALPSQIVDAAIPLASQAEAEAGSDNTKRVTPLWVKQAIDAIGISADSLAAGLAPKANTADLASTDDGKGAAKIGFKQSGTGAVARTVQAKAREVLSVADFGATGDGVTNDASAINSAYAAAEAVGGAEVFWPAGDYSTGSTTITCGPLSSTRASGGAFLTYSGADTAFIVQGINAAETYGQRHVMPYIRRSSLDWDSLTDTTSVGLVLQDRKYNSFVVSGIKRFNEGLALQAIVGNFVCNTIDLGVVQNCRISIDFSRVAVGWGINQNTFVGGACVINSAYTNAPDRVYINMPNVENNTNTFVGTNLEKSAVEKAIVCASASNVFLNCRYEGSGSAPGYITVSGNNNRFIGGAPASSSTPPFVTWVNDTGSGNVFWMSNILGSKFLALDFHSATRSIRFGNGTAYPAVPLGAYGTDRLSLGDSTTTAFRHFGLVQQESPAITAGAKLPWRNALVLTYASATTITGMATNVALGDTSAVVAITSTNGNATLQHTASPAAGSYKFVLKGGANLLLTANTPRLFQLVLGNLYEI